MNYGPVGQPALRKAAWRLIPFLCLLYILNILDRANVGFARLTMEKDLGMSPEVFDLGVGFFYVGYLLFEVPSNLLLRKTGARLWIGRIMISWGVISSLTLFVRDAREFYLVRVLLGLAEAGFFPGIILYLTYWFPARERARMTAYFMMAIALASVLGNPVSGLIMQHLDGAAGWHGWQWLFLLEGVPSVLLGVVVLLWLPDGPEKASWLTPEERRWLTDHLKEEERDRHRRHGASHLLAMLDWRVWLLIALYSTVAIGSNASGAYFPKLIQGQFTEASKSTIGWLSALPHLSAMLIMALFSISSDRTGERRWHVAGAALLAALGWAMAYRAPTPWLALIGLCLAQAGMMSMLPVFWTLPTLFLTGVAAAGGIALINSVANIGGIFGPWLLGKFGPGAMAGALLLGAGLALCVRREADSSPLEEGRKTHV